MKEKALVIKFGGSHATNLDGVNSEYIHWFFESLGSSFKKVFVQAAFVIGGGNRVRKLQKNGKSDKEKDKIGMNTLREHSSQMRSILIDNGIDVCDHIPTNYKDANSTIKNLKNYAICFGGLEVGQSTDAVAITAAELFEELGYEVSIIVLSNVDRIFTDDPNINNQAYPIKKSSVDMLVNEGVLVDEKKLWKPGMSISLDPIAVKKLSRLLATLFFASAKDLNNINNFIFNKELDNGTMISYKNRKTEYYE
jgi:uridylate kinase